MKILILIITFVTFFCCDNVAQEKLLKKSWIKQSIEEFSRPQTPDTTYMRYTFNNAEVYFGFEPGWNSASMPYSIKGNALTLGFDKWIIETLNDSSLTIFIQGFRRVKFLSENYLRMKDNDIVQIGQYKGKPLYKANQIITPRYMKANDLRRDILKEDRSDDYNIRKAGVFSISFIVTEEGRVEEPKIITGVAESYDKNVIRELLRTSKYWQPATTMEKPIQTLMILEVKFLDSLDQSY